MKIDPLNSMQKNSGSASSLYDYTVYTIQLALARYPALSLPIGARFPLRK